MFKKLNIRFILINMTSTLVVVGCIFVSIYLYMQQSSNKSDQNMLNRLLDMVLQAPRDGNIPPFNMNNIIEEKDIKIKPWPEKFSKNNQNSISVIIKTDDNFNFLEVLSFNKEIDNDLKNSLPLVASSKKDLSSLSIQGITYKFLKRKVDNGFIIVFLDNTVEDWMLNNLIVIILVSGSISMILMFIISIFLSQKALIPVKKAWERQNEFICDASHELKTPITIIKANTDLLLLQKEANAQNQIKWLFYIKAETERMTDLINNLFCLTKMDSHEVNYEKERFDLSEFIKEISLRFDPICFENKLTLEQNISDGIFITGNNERLRQVIEILLDNACKHANKDSIVEITLTKKGNKAYITVINQGEPINEEDLKKIFYRFYRIDKSRSRENGGFGLGLAIAKAIIDDHNGSIIAESTENGKISFIIELDSK